MTVVTHGEDDRAILLVHAYVDGELDPANVIAEFNFINAWPLKVSGPAPNANSSDLAMEEIELICEQVIRVT